MRNNIFFVFQSMCSQSGRILGLECLTRYPSLNTSIEDFFRGTNAGVKCKIFNMQLNLILRNISFFEKRHILVTLNVDNDIIDKCISSKIIDLINEAKYIRLEINELVTNENIVKINKLCIHKQRLLWFDDFVFMKNDLSIINQNCFECVKIDKNFFWDSFENDDKFSLFNEVMNSIKDRNMSVVIEGVENINHKKWLSNFDFFAMQGFLWPEISANELFKNN